MPARRIDRERMSRKYGVDGRLHLSQLQSVDSIHRRDGACIVLQRARPISLNPLTSLGTFLSELLPEADYQEGSENGRDQCKICVGEYLFVDASCGIRNVPG